MEQGVQMTKAEIEAILKQLEKANEGWPTCRDSTSDLANMARNYIPILIAALKKAQFGHDDAITLSEVIASTLNDTIERNKEYQAENTRLRAAIDGLFDAIKHGDSDHQVWLKKKIKDYFNDEALK